MKMSNSMSKGRYAVLDLVCASMIEHERELSKLINAQKKVLKKFKDLERLFGEHAEEMAKVFLKDKIRKEV